MKTWWLETAWPWLKENWWVMLLIPLIILVAVGMWAQRNVRKTPKAVDPLKKADKRAEKEENTREKKLKQENERLRKRIGEIKESSKERQKRFENKLKEEVPQLRNDPEKLKRLMLRVGKDA